MKDIPQNKLVIIGSIIAFVFILGFGIWLIYDISENRRLDATAVIYRADRETVEFGSDYHVADFLASIEGELVDNDAIDTTTLGEHEVKFHYRNIRRRKRLATLRYTVVDTQAPIIYGQHAYTVNKGYEGDLTDLILSGDDADDHPKREVAGKYDLNRTGNYHLQYIATDASGNIAKHNFTLHVVNPESVPETTSSTDNNLTPISEIISEYRNGNTEVGIDVSSWQGKINWSKIKTSGVEFVMIRLGYQIEYGGEYIVDQNFISNIKGALAAGLPVGVYLYSCADSVDEARKQADWVLDQIKDYPIELGIAFDWENWSIFNQAGISFYTLGQIANTFLAEVESSGYRGMLYGSKNYLETFWRYNSHGIWLAQYYNHPTYDKPFQLWQLTDSGKVGGIDTAVDIDLLYK